MTRLKEVLKTEQGKSTRFCYVNGVRVVPLAYDKKLKQLMQENEVTYVLNRASQEIYFKT